MTASFQMLVLLLGTCLAFENMNGEYVTTPTPHANGTVNTKFSAYPGGVEVCGSIPTKHSSKPGSTQHLTFVCFFLPIAVR
jgi:hypothetical protein